MKRFFTFLLLLITVAVGPSVLMGQQLTVLGFMEYTDDITARTQSGGRRDAQGNPCALVRVILVEPGATFASNDLIEASDLNVNQYLVYMAEGATTLDVSLPGFLPLKVKFAELSPEVSALQRESTYILTLATHNDGSNYQYLEIRVSPSDATLEVDHSIWEMRNGYAAKRVMLGNHDYRISAPNYHTEEGRIAVFDANNKTSKTFNLQPAFGKVNIFIDVEDNQLAFYLDDKKMSRDAITQQTLPSGEHQLRIEGDGYKTYTETFVIIDGLITSLRPQLVPEYHYGSVAIESLPFGGATIQIDGKNIGTTPMVYNDLLVGQHLIRLSMAGFADKDTTITIKQGENLEITLVLEPNLFPTNVLAISDNQPNSASEDFAAMKEEINRIKDDTTYISTEKTSSTVRQANKLCIEELRWMISLEYQLDQLPEKQFWRFVRILNHPRGNAVRSFACISRKDLDSIGIPRRD